MNRWRLTIGTNHYYLTKEEKDFYLNSLASGQEYVVMGNKVLSSRFMDLVSDDALEETKNIDEGKYLCAFGKWHVNKTECHCGESYIFDKKTNKYIVSETRAIV